MSQYPFPTNLSRVFEPSQITVLERDDDDHPTTVCVSVDSPGDRAVAPGAAPEQPA